MRITRRSNRGKAVHFTAPEFREFPAVRQGKLRNGWVYKTKPSTYGSKQLVIGDNQRQRRLVCHVIDNALYCEPDCLGEMDENEVIFILQVTLDDLYGERGDYVDARQ